MVKLYDGGVYLVNGTEIVEDNHDAEAILKQKMGDGVPSKAEAAKNTIAYGILKIIIHPAIWTNFRSSLTN